MEAIGRVKMGRNRSNGVNRANKRVGLTCIASPAAITEPRAHSSGPKMPPKQPGQNTFELTPTTLLYLALPLGYLLYQYSTGSDGSQQISFNDFRTNMLEKGYVDHLVVVNKEIVRVYLRPDAPAQLSGRAGVPFQGTNPRASRFYFTIGWFGCFTSWSNDICSRIPFFYCRFRRIL